jgi:hypothetical protein
MYTALSATSRTLQGRLEREFRSDANLAGHFDPDVAGPMVVSLNTPKEMLERETEGVSLWLYRLVRDEQRLNTPPVRVSEDQFRRAPLPVRLHYLITPVISSTDLIHGPEMEQIVLGKVLQVFHDHPSQRCSALQGDFVGTDVELHVRLEQLTLEEIARVWDALDRSYQLSVSYEVSVVEIESALQPRVVPAVREAAPEQGLLLESE